MARKQTFWKRASQFDNRLQATWALELVALIFGLCCLLAIAGILLWANGKEVGSTNGLTLNAYIAILSDASVLGLSFAAASSISQAKWNIFWKEPHYLTEFEELDAASQGPLGSLKLLIKRKNVATIGAVATLIAIAFNTFSQQLLQTNTSLEYKPNANVHIPRASRYDGGYFYSWNNIPSKLGFPLAYARSDFGMQSAVLNGLAQTSSIVAQTLPYTCSSGNCTWPETQNIATCSQCNDLSSHVTQIDSSGAPMAFSVDAAAAVAPTQFGNLTRFELPNGLTIDNLNGATGAAALLMTTLSTTDPKQTVTMGELDTMIISIAMLKANFSRNSAWPNMTIQATECAIYYCVKTYNSSLVNNILHESSSVLSDHNRSEESFQPLTPLNYLEVASLQNNISTPTIAFNTSWSGISRSDLMLGDGFNISQAGVMGVSSYAQDTFIWSPEAWQILANSSDFTFNGYYSSYYANALEGSPDWQPPASAAIYLSSDINETFQVLASSMSNAMRTASSGVMESGNLGLMITRYTVKWAWITLPVFVALLAGLQLIITITHSRGVPLWKSSTLANLSRGPLIADLFKGTKTLQEFADAAVTRKVNLFSNPVQNSSSISTTQVVQLPKAGSPYIALPTTDAEDGEA